MPKVSSRKVKKEIEDKIWQQFVAVLTEVDDRTVFKSFLHDLLTPMEKTMLSKRLMIAWLIYRNVSTASICDLLKVTKATVNNIKREFSKSGKGYRSIFEKFAKKKGEKEDVFLNLVAKLVNAARLPVKGSRRDMVRWRNAMDELFGES